MVEMQKERKPVKNGGDVGTKLCGVTTSWAAAPEVLCHRQMIAPVDKRNVVFFLHPWFDPIRIQQSTWQWCPKGRECTSWKDVLPLRCSLLPSLWSGDSSYIGGGRWGWFLAELTLNCLSKVILTLGMQLCSIMAAIAYMAMASEDAKRISFMFVSRIPWE